jgi:hypothetical protein
LAEHILIPLAVTLPDEEDRESVLRSALEAVPQTDREGLKALAKRLRRRLG